MVVSHREMKERQRMKAEQEERERLTAIKVGKIMITMCLITSYIS